MKLELKHLAHYLPYKLKIRYFDKNILMNCGQGSSTHWIGINAILKRQDSNCMPILRPLSDLTKEIEIDGKKFIPNNMFNTQFEYMFNHVEMFNISADFPYFVVEKLFEWHFDVFGLIDSGLAIDINTLQL